MRIKFGRDVHGSALLVTLLACFVIGLALASYLTLVSNQHLSTMRSLAWNSAIPVIEAGVEEALSQLQHTGITNLSANHWTDLGNGYYFKRLSVSSDQYYEVNIKKVDPPVIISTGHVLAPLAPS